MVILPVHSDWKHRCIRRLVDVSLGQKNELFQLYLRNVTTGHHDESNKPVCHVDFDRGVRYPGVLFPRVGGCLDGGGSRKTILKRIGKDDVSLL